MPDFALPDLSPLVPPAAEAGVRVLYGKVTALSPFAVLIDGDTGSVGAVACVSAAVNDRVVMLLQRNVLVAIGVVGATCPHRIGDYYMTEATTSPADRWPGTTWVELAGRVLVGRDAAQTEFDTIGEQGGHKALQQHSHPMPAANGAGGATVVIAGANTETKLRDVATLSAGTGDSQNLQPYRVCYVWRRTA